MHDDTNAATTAESTGQTEPTESDVPAEALLVEELLVEEVSIDGMCGVY
jgi:mycofactocin precursor